MDKEHRINKLKRCLSNLPSYKLLKKSSLISTDTFTSSSEIPKKQKDNNLNKSIEEQIVKAKILISHAKQKLEIEKKLPQNSETSAITLQHFKQRNKVLHVSNFIKKTTAPRSNSHESLPGQFSSRLTPQSSEERLLLSPSKRMAQKLKIAQNLQRPFISSNTQVQNLLQARDIDSFVLDQGQQLQLSIIQQCGESVLNWALCKAKASQFKILKFVDEGKFGKVYLAQSHRNGVIYSIKSIYRNTLNETHFQQLVREVKIQSFVDHPGIVKIYNFFVDEDSAYLVLEPCLGGNLYQYLKKHERVSQKLVKQWIKQVCLAVQYLHKNDIIHRDLKPQNILLHENTIKICDFGWAVHSPLLRGTLCGTPLYTSPEIVCKKPYDSKIDIWSIGVLTYELIYGNIPFQIRHWDDMVKIVEQQVFFSNQINASQAIKDFISKCLKKNPFDRPTIRELLEHEFLNKIDKLRWTIR